MLASRTSLGATSSLVDDLAEARDRKTVEAWTT